MKQIITKVVLLIGLLVTLLCVANCAEAEEESVYHMTVLGRVVQLEKQPEPKVVSVSCTTASSIFDADAVIKGPISLLADPQIRVWLQTFCKDHGLEFFYVDKQRMCIGFNGTKNVTFGDFEWQKEDDRY